MLPSTVPLLLNTPEEGQHQQAQSDSVRNKNMNIYYVSLRTTAELLANFYSLGVSLFFGIFIFSENVLYRCSYFKTQTQECKIRTDPLMWKICPRTQIVSGFYKFSRASARVCVKANEREQESRPTYTLVNISCHVSFQIWHQNTFL